MDQMNVIIFLNSDNMESCKESKFIHNPTTINSLINVSVYIAILFIKMRSYYTYCFIIWVFFNVTLYYG